MYDDYKYLLDGYRGESDMYWSDFGSIQAIKILEKFDEKDWQILIIALSSQSENWLIACAETLSEVEISENIIEILKILISMNSSSIKIAVVDTINSFLQQQIPIPDSLKELVKVNVKDLKVSNPVEDFLLNSIKSKI